VPGVAEKSMPLPDVPMTRLPVDRLTSPDNVGAADSTVLPVPVLVVTPVPPLRTGSAVPDKVIANVPLVVTGEPEIDKNAGTDAATLVTVPVVVSVAQLGNPAATTSRCPVVPIGSLATVFAALAYIMSPAVYEVRPVPP